MQQTNNFRVVTTGSLIGLIGITLLTTAKATHDSAAWWGVQQEKTQAESTKAIADAYQKNQVTTFDTLTVNDYTLNNTPPRIDWQHTVDPRKKTLIFDRYRKCVGYAHQGKFYFTLYYKGACN
jgi:hypothetical protein